MLRISCRGGARSSFNAADGNDGGGEGIACFAELVATNGIFVEHKIESIAGNVIVFDIDLVQFRTALAATLQSMGSSASSGEKAAPLHNSYTEDTHSSFRQSLDNGQFRDNFVVVMKLAKRSGLPCLCLDASCVNGTLDVHHAVPVRILRAEEWQCVPNYVFLSIHNPVVPSRDLTLCYYCPPSNRNHLPPIVNTPDVQLEFQLERPLRAVIERMKSISPILYIDGSMSGEFVVRIDNDSVSIRTFYDKLVPWRDEASPSKDKKCTLKLDSKKLLAALQWQQSMSRFTVRSYILCMIHNEMMVVHVILNPEELGFFTYYVPVHYLGDDDL